MNWDQNNVRASLNQRERQRMDNTQRERVWGTRERRKGQIIVREDLKKRRQQEQKVTKEDKKETKSIFNHTDHKFSLLIIKQLPIVYIRCCTTCQGEVDQSLRQVLHVRQKLGLGLVISLKVIVHTGKLKKLENDCVYHEKL